MKKILSLLFLFFVFAAAPAQMLTDHPEDDADWGPSLKGKIRVWHHAFNTKSDQSGFGFRYRRFTVDSVQPEQMPFGWHYVNLQPFIKKDPKASHFLDIGIRWEKNQHIASCVAGAGLLGLAIASLATTTATPGPVSNALLWGDAACWSGVLICHFVKRIYVYRSISRWDADLDKGIYRY